MISRYIETVPAKTIVVKTKTAAWFGADYNMNIYRGCPHGCIYCDSRSDCYRNYDFQRVKVKENALALVRNELSRKRIRGVISTGAMSDPYNPLEKVAELTRGALTLVDASGFGIAIATKSPLVARDRDILQRIARRGNAIVKITVTCADDETARAVEPFVAPSSKRFEALRTLADAGIFAGVLMMPLLPYVNDTPDNVAGIVRLAAEHGARFVYPTLGLSMRAGQREYLYAHLDRLYPGIKRKYIAAYGESYQCPSPHAGHLWDVFRSACRQHGILYEMGRIVAAYRKRREGRQLELF